MKLSSQIVSGLITNTSSSSDLLIRLKIPPPVPKIVSPSSTISIFNGNFLFSIKLIIFLLNKIHLF